MNMISYVVPRSIATAAATDQSFGAVALVSCLGLLASACLMMFGINLGMAWS
ncbi:hypothetical protein [Bradyrhizobium sp.]|uniref:hypothetical protein n=1 Tax=Bradyrhizobium sp. TaxID=376 RepID=UPI003C31E322